MVGNDLNRRKYEVVFVERKEGVESSFQEKWLKLEEKRGEEKEIEEDIVRELQSRHERWISNQM